MPDPPGALTSSFGWDCLEYKNLLISMRLESYVNPTGNNLDNEWNDYFDFLDKMTVDYTYNNNNKDMLFHFGQINNVFFGETFATPASLYY